MEQKKLRNIDKYYQTITQFYKRFGGKYKDRSEKSKKKLINELIKHSNMKFEYKNGLTTSEVRSRFNNSKRFNKLIGKKCFVCGYTAYQRHHIIQIQNGGRNDKRNVIPICRQCHCLIHPWLNKEQQ